jgi:hypothetical protein
VDSLLFAQLASTVIFVAGTLIFGEIRNARGVFAIFMISGSFLPFALSYLAGIESPISDMPLMSPEGKIGCAVRHRFCRRHQHVALRGKNAGRPAEREDLRTKWLYIQGVFLARDPHLDCLYRADGAAHGRPGQFDHPALPAHIPQ